MIIIIEI